jgi:sugar (pentulose or hexulose) kinase
MKARCVAGVDLGSGSARALAIDPDGTVVGAARSPYAGYDTWPAGRADPRSWLAAVEDALRALRRSGFDPEAVCVGGQSPTSVPVGGGFAVTVRHPAGVEGDPVSQHYAQREVLGGDARQVWDWVLLALGAEDAQGRWPGDPELDGYGPVRTTGEVVGHARAGDGPLAAGTALVTGAADAYLAFWAGGTDTPGRALDPGGRTGGLAVAVASGNRPDGMWALASAAAGVDIVGGPVASHGIALEWLANVLGRELDELLEAAGTVPPGAGGVVALPYLEGERAPRWNRSLRGEVTGLTPETGPAELCRAFLEGTAYGLAHIAADLRSSGVPIDVVVIGGSPARSRIWCAIKADVLGVPVEVPDEPDLAAYGAALGAGAGAGWWPAPGQGASGDWPRPATTTIEPTARPEYGDGYERFIALGDEAERRGGAL